MHAYVIGVMHEWVRSPGDYDLAAAAPALVDVMLAGLRAQPPRLISPTDAGARSRCAEHT
jgi:TetR/AcrR family acrAB operon transcriptional repressor